MTIDLTQDTVTITHPSLTRAEFEAAITAGEEIIGFVGGVEVALNVLDGAVPDSFTGNTYAAEDGAITAYTWGAFGNVIANDTNAILIIGKTDENGNRQNVVGDAELREWTDYFGATNIMTKSEMMRKIAADYTPSDA